MEIALVILLLVMGIGGWRIDKGSRKRAQIHHIRREDKAA